MNIVAIDRKTFEQMKQGFEGFAKEVKALCGENQDKERWLTNRDICELLHISSRTLQTYRDNGTLPYSQIGRKCYYKASDIQQFISQSHLKNK
ncbi:hypothetical protein EZS27_030950 [termite gut metagenome]|uniref:Helix-turn-helix domain-containing protein n=1 Tax=termite gut metagenome TaxID=433724 RepID=A0A5J4QE67_9ZZZZ